MFKKNWYKVLAWLAASFYFFMMSGTVISIFSPGPTEEQTMQWMQGHMNAMHTSLMGWTMESHGALNRLLAQSGALVFPALFSGGVIGAFIRLRRLKHHG